MSETTAPIALQAQEGEALWFLGALVTVKVANDGVLIADNHAPRGHGSPLHVHRNEDEWFLVTEGELTFWVGGQTIVAGPGAFVFGPRDVPHTFSVTSDEARFLLGTQPGSFAGFLRALAEPAGERVIPPPATEPPDVAALAAVAAGYGVEILGPPGIPD
jgi:quercetin dioxygenase-like cupin family protein